MKNTVPRPHRATAGNGSERPDFGDPDRCTTCFRPDPAMMIIRVGATGQAGIVRVVPGSGTAPPEDVGNGIGAEGADPVVPFPA